MDCLDALASDRQYRRALPLDEAMKVVRRESGKAFDPQSGGGAGAALRRAGAAWRRRRSARPGKLSTDVKVERGEAPAAGLRSVRAARGRAAAKEAPIDFLNSIAAARQEVQALFEISQDLGNSLSLDETLSVLARSAAARSFRIIRWRSGCAATNVLMPEYVTGDDFRLFSSLEIPVGQGLSGWVAENRKPILNGNPSVEPGYLNDPDQVLARCGRRVAVPLEGVNGVLGVLTLYHAGARRLHQGSSAHPAGDQLQDRRCRSKTRCASARWNRRRPPTI